MRNIKKLICILLIAVFAIALSMAQGNRFEAETAVLSGNTLTIQNSIPGYSGTGYVGRFENEGDKITFQFNLNESLSYRLYVGYAAPFGDKINNIEINGNRGQMQFPGQGNNFRESLFGKIRLKNGQNTVVISKSWGWFYVDYIRIELNTDPDVQFEISDRLVTPEPAEFANREFKYLLDNFQKNIHSGVMDTKDAEWLKANTGKYPALLGVDLMNHTRYYSWYDKNILVREATDWYTNHGLVAVCWHWRDPLRKTEEFYTDKTTFDVSKITDTLSEEYRSMLSDIDLVAPYLKALQDARIPVLFRPLHEAAGKWFWWGAKGPEPCKSLWKLIFNRLTGYHQLNNLIWVWTTDTQADNQSWYPGDEWVDILGADIYAPNGDFGSQVLTFEKIKEDFKGKKLITLSENGVMPDPDHLQSDLAGWSWFMTWYGHFVRDANINPLSYWQKILNHPYVITRDEMPDRTSGSSIDDKPDNPGPVYSVFRNSTDNQLMIQSSDATRTYDIYVYDLTGRLHFHSLENTGNLSVAVDRIDHGIYLVKLVSGKTCENFKVIL